MNRSALLNQLLSFSQKHLSLLNEEAWEEWEAVAREKTDLCRRLSQLNDKSLDEGEKQILSAIEEFESKTRDELERKKNESREELAKIKRAKEAWKGYRGSAKRSSSRRFDLKC